MPISQVLAQKQKGLAGLFAVLANHYFPKTADVNQLWVSAENSGRAIKSAK